MSHSHERKEKICLNCNAELFDRYCHVCGQENIEPKESFIGLLAHFFYDITHFDGKFFSTVKYLVLRPGYLSLEYIRGRRASYLHPIRMYVFTSAFFFIIFFAMFHFGEPGDVEANDNIEDSTISIFKKEAGKEINTGSNPVDISDSLKQNRPKVRLSIEEAEYKTKAAYDSAQKALPSKERDGWFKRTKMHKQIEIVEKLEKDPRGMIYVWIAKFMHMLPQLLFISLPIFALILKLLYRRKKQFYYADHAIFSIHLYIFTFITMLIYFLFTRLYDTLEWRLINYLRIGIGLYIVFYTYLAMLKFYQQGRFKTFVKYFLLSFMSFIVLLFLFGSFFILSIFQI